MLPQVQVLEGGHCGDSGCLIPGTASGDMCHPIDSGNVMLNEQWPLGKMWNVYLSLPLHK